MSYLGYSQWRRIARIVGAVALGYVSIWDPSIAAAELIGMIQTGGIVNPNFFGTIDPGTGAVAPLGTATFASGKYATTYDPVRDIFYVSDLPTSNGSFISSIIREINGKTGAETDIFAVSGGRSAFVVGLEVNPTTGMLIGMIEPSGGPNFFGTIDPGTGAVAPLGTATFASGKYATTYDPVRDIFYVSDVPTNNGTSFSSQIREINGKTGAETDIFLSGAGGFAFLVGLEVRNTGIAAAPEPPTVLLLLGGLLGIVLYARRGPRSTLR